MENSKLEAAQQFIGGLRAAEKAIQRAVRLNKLRAVIYQLDQLPDFGGILLGLQQMKSLFESLRTDRAEPPMIEVQKAQAALLEMLRDLANLGDLDRLIRELEVVKGLQTAIFAHQDIDALFSQLDLDNLPAKLETLKTLRVNLQRVGSVISGRG